MTDLETSLAALRNGAPADSAEGPELEFTAPDPSVKRTLEIVTDAVVCLANSAGGTVVLGVADVPGDHGTFVGVPG